MIESIGDEEEEDNDKDNCDNNAIENDLNYVVSNHQGVNVEARNFLGHVLRDLAKAGTK